MPVVRQGQHLEPARDLQGPRVPDRLDASLAEPATGKEEWHRFWIEQLESPVEVSSDGRTLLLGARLGVRTEYMEVAGGALRSGKLAPSGSAKQFADHLTDNYDGYSREFAVYGQLHGFAQMTTLAHALADDDVPAEVDRARSSLDFMAFAGTHVVRAVDTPATTPAIVVTKQVTSGNLIRRVALTGGVNLAPSVRYAAKSDAADRIQADVRRAVAADPGRAWWTIRRQSDSLVVTRRSLANATTKVWQTDMVVGRVRFARASHGEDRPDSIGRYWRPMLPELQFSADTVKVEGLGTMPRRVTLTTADGERLSMGQHATLQMPGQPRTPGFVRMSGPKKKRTALYLYRNGLVLEDGDVKYVSIDNGPPQREIPDGASVVEFSPDAPHRAQRIHTSEGTIDVLWAGPRFAGFGIDSGERIEVRYDKAGRMIGLRGSDGQVVEYRVDSRGRLYAVVNGRGDSISYVVAGEEGPATSISAQFLESTGGRATTYDPVEISQSIPTETLRQQVAARSNDTTVYVGVFNAPAGSGRAFDVVVGGQEVAMAGDLDAVVEAVLDVEKGKGPQSTRLRKMVLDAAPSSGRTDVVVVGERSMRNAMARALKHTTPDRVIWTATDPELAARNLAARAAAARGVRHVHVAEGVEPSIDAAIAPLAAQHARDGGGLVIVSGDNSTHLQMTIDRLAARGDFRGRAVLLVTCGKSGGGVDKLLHDAGAVQVSAFVQPVRQQVLEPFLAGIYRRLDSSKQLPATEIRKIVEEVVKDLGAQPGSNLTVDDVRLLQMQIWQIGRLEDGADSPVVAMPTGGPAV